jgi:hypothetical protein
LQRRGPLDENPEHRVTLSARVVWWGQDGVGMAFSLPLDLNLDLWQSAMSSAEEIGDPGDILAPFRLAETLAFLGRICPSAVQELRQLVCRELGKTRAANAVEIALEAELLLAAEPDADRMLADPAVIRRIVEDGSWADEDWIRHLWAGLLSSYCGTGQTPESDLDLVERFSQLAPVHLCIFNAACERATKMVSDTPEVFAQPLIFTFSEIQNMTGTASLEKIEHDLHHLAEVGLIENLPLSQSLTPTREEAFVTPSRLGLALYARCHRHRRAPESLYGVGREVRP